MTMTTMKTCPTGKLRDMTGLRAVFVGETQRGTLYIPLDELHSIEKLKRELDRDDGLIRVCEGGTGVSKAQTSGIDPMLLVASVAFAFGVGFFLRAAMYG